MLDVFWIPVFRPVLVCVRSAVWTVSCRSSGFLFSLIAIFRSPFLNIWKQHDKNVFGRHVNRFLPCEFFLRSFSLLSSLDCCGNSSVQSCIHHCGDRSCMCDGVKIACYFSISGSILQFDHPRESSPFARPQQEAVPTFYRNHGFGGNWCGWHSADLPTR